MHLPEYCLHIWPTALVTSPSTTTTLYLHHKDSNGHLALNVNRSC